jgi:myo-inositol-1(or 4)-monophosphatase
MTPDPPELLAAAMTAAQIGGEVLRGYFRDLEPGQVAEKDRNDWVSEADRASERAILGSLARAAPDVGVLAEEGGASGSIGTRWLVDPLDGTLNFVRGFPHFAVSVGLVVEGRLEVGVVYDPMRDELFAARRGGGATRNGAPIRVTGRPGLQGAFVTTGFPYRVHRYLDTFLAVFRDVFMEAGALRRPGAAALDLAHTAAGIFDGFFEFCLSPWDIAAGTLLVREAGGIVTDLDGGPDVLVHGNVVAASPGVHRDLLAAIRRHASEGAIVP